MYKDSGVRNVDVNSPYAYYASTTDYTNWEDTYRVTAGVGYRIDKFNIDLAYQYNTTNGSFTPYMSFYEAPETVKVSDKRHQVMLTLGYTF